MHDVFISYEHESKSIADNVVSFLESRRIRCWYAPRDVMGDYATSIVEAIQQCKVFVLILSETASDSPHVLNEVEIAYKRIIEGDLTIIPFKLDSGNLSMAMEYYIKRLHWIDASNASLESAISSLCQQVADALPDFTLEESEQEKPGKRQAERIKNMYFQASDKKELRRLRTQADLMKGFDSEVYEAVLVGKENLSVLDVGSNDGSHIMDRLGSKQEVTHVCGVEVDAAIVQRANEMYGSDTIAFYACDCESDELDDALYEYEEKTGVRRFDIINLSMIMLHMKRPFKVLKTIRRHVHPGSIIVVRDIDDGLNLAYPDPDGSFARVFRICDYLETSGFRASGRQIYGLLKKTGFKKVSLVKQGLSTAGMNFDQRSALFDTYFSFIVDDLKIMHDRHPEDAIVADDLEWYMGAYDELEEEFQNEDFFFNLGMMMFVGTV